MISSLNVIFPLNRYWAVTNVDYIHSRTSNRVFTMIFLVWFAAVIVSLAPQFGWKDPEYLQRIEEQKCMVSQDVAYQVRAQDTLSLCNIHSYNSHSLPPSL